MKEAIYFSDDPIDVVYFLKPINNFPGYFVSNNGKIFSNLGKGNRRNDKSVDLYELKPRISQNGYARVYMREESSNKRKDQYIHILVASHFIPNPDNKEQVNHKNSIRTKNRADNLEWVTSKENNEYTFKMNHLIRNEKGQFVGNYNKYKSI